MWSIMNIANNLYYLLYSCTNLILGKNLASEIWTIMLLIDPIVGFLNQIYPENKMMKYLGFLHVDINYGN